MVCFSVGKIQFYFLTYTHRLLRKERTSRNLLNVKENDTSGRGTPASEVDGRGRRPKKGKTKANDYGSKRKLGIKSLSVTPEGDDEYEGEGHNTVSFINYHLEFIRTLNN